MSQEITRSPLGIPRFTERPRLYGDWDLGQANIQLSNISQYRGGGSIVQISRRAGHDMIIPVKCARGIKNGVTKMHLTDCIAKKPH